MSNAVRIPNKTVEMHEVSETPETRPDQRREPRYRVDKHLQIFSDGLALPARLVNESMQGFCIRVARGCVRTGQFIRLCFAWGEVEARVMWTRDVGKDSEAGLFVP